MTGSGLLTVCCLKGRAHCATAPNQKRPQKSNPAKRPRLCSPAASPAGQPGMGGGEGKKIPGSFANWKNPDDHERPIRVADDDSSSPIRELNVEVRASVAG